MTQFVKTIPEQKDGLFQDTVQKQDLVSTGDPDGASEAEIPEEQKQMVRDRIKTIQRTEVLTWDAASEKIRCL